MNICVSARHHGVLSLRVACLLLFLLGLLACSSGGSSGDDSSSGNCGIADCSPRAWVSVPSITAYAGQTVILDGSSSTPQGMLDYRWEQLTGPSVEIQDANKSVASITIPTFETDQALVFRLIVSKGNQDGVAQIGVTVKPLKVEATVSAAKATVGSPVFLHATVKGDDSADLRYLWEQIGDSGLAVAIANADSENASFSTQVVIESVLAKFRVTVTNRFGAFAQAETEFVEFLPGIVPSITSAFPAHISVGEKVKISGSGLTNVRAVKLIRGNESFDINLSDVQIASDHELEFSMPAISEGQYQVVVENSGGQAATALAIASTLENVSQVAVGYSHSCAITRDETVLCWGPNAFNAPADTSNSSGGLAVKVRLENEEVLGSVKGIAAGVFSNCALRSDKTVWCWGNNSRGQLGDGTLSDHPYAAPVVGLPDEIVGLAGAAYHYCALTSAGDAYCWGDNSHGQTGGNANSSNTASLVSLDKKLTSIAAGATHTCGVILTENSVICWGSNEYGQLGNPSVQDSTSLAEVLNSQTNTKLMDISAVAVGSKHSCALSFGGRIFCWGDNDAGQLGTGDFRSRSTAIQIKDESGNGFFEGAISIVIGLNEHRDSKKAGQSCALKNTHRVYCWGENNYGQLGDGSTADKSIPVQVKGIENVASFAMGGNSGCAILASSSIFCWGSNFAGQLGSIDIGLGGHPVTVKNLNNVASISAGGVGLYDDSFSCALSTTGLVSCWGRNDQGQLGIGTVQDSATPAPVSLPNVSAIASGGSHSCAVSAGRVYCWGSNTDKYSIYSRTIKRTMKLGSDSVDQSPTPILVNGISDIESVAVGTEHSCALSNSGDVYCWGDSAAGIAEVSAVPTRVARLPARAVQIAAGAIESCALVVSGDVYCWRSSDPVRISIPSDVQVLDIAVGMNQTCASAAGGSVYCWGGNEQGQLGNGSLLASNYPVKVIGINNAQNIAASGVGIFFNFYGFSCALQSHNNGSVSCWGTNDVDQLGDGSGVDQSTPVSVPGLHGIKQIASGGTHSCALYHDGYVACWGGLFGGQLGQAPLTPRAVLQ